MTSRQSKIRPPVLTPDMLTPVDAPVSATDAKRIFREWMIAIGFLSNDDPLDRMEIAEHLRYFTEAMRDHEAMLKDDVDSERASWQEEISQCKADLRAMRRELAKSADPADRAELTEEIAGMEIEIARTSEYVDKARKALSAFKSDKREFLVDYINTQVHGQGWRT